VRDDGVGQAIARLLVGLRFMNRPPLKFTGRARPVRPPARPCLARVQKAGAFAYYGAKEIVWSVTLGLPVFTTRMTHPRAAVVQSPFGKAFCTRRWIDTVPVAAAIVEVSYE
jgi:hypothetical protein